MMFEERKRILIVEDDPNTLAVVKEALEDAGYETAIAESGGEALNAVNVFKPHLVVTDHNMPDLTGLEMLKSLRSRENYVTVLFLSARGDAEFVAQTLREGADDYIRKPFRLDEFLARVEVALRTSELHRELFVANVKLQEIVEKDHLTDLYNMRSMYERIDYELKRAKRFKRSVACVMLDMDHFKRVNDDHDHLFGSFVLKEVGQLIKKNLREIDFAARYGGDEFLVVISETDSVGVKTVCERLRSTIEEHTFVSGKDSIKLTVSLGYSLYSGDDEEKGRKIDARELVRRADNALYVSKREGRNMVSKFAS